jgi:hypothetical protein
LPGVQLNCRSIPAGLVFGLTDEAQYFKLLNGSMACVPFEGTSKMSFLTFSNVFLIPIRM